LGRPGQAGVNALATYHAGVQAIPSLGSRGEGWVILQLMCLALVGLAGRFAPGQADSSLATAALWIGGTAVLLGVALVIAGSIELRRAKAFTALPHPREGGELVESGPFRFVRHPLYAGLIFASVGWAVMHLSLVAALAGVLLAVVLDLKRRREESWLVERFAGYREYRERTKAFVPFVY
jgi:protein-S-isoprenylcysteine O-methyltransferase Ste14